MLQILVIIIQFVTLIFIGGFARTSTLQSSFSYFGTNILFFLSWILLSTPYKHLTLHTLTLLLITASIAFQSNLLFGRFWYSVFNNFSTSYQLTTSIMIQCTMAIFTSLLVLIDYVGIFRHWQIYVILPVVIDFGWALNYCVMRYGLIIMDGCGGLSIYVFAGVCSVAIWVVAVRGRPERYAGINYKQQQNMENMENNKGNDKMVIMRENKGYLNTDIYIKQEYYNGYTISLYGGVIGAFLLWPSFNASLGMLSSATSTLLPAIKNSSLFQTTAYTNTILSLSMGTVLSFMLINRDRTHQHKSKIRTFIDCFLYSGIICASFMDIALNPATVMVLALISTICILIFYWYYHATQHKPNKISSLSAFIVVMLHYSRALFRIVFGLIGIVVTAIVVSSRQGSTVLLLNIATYGSNIYAKTAGLEVVGYLVTFGFAAVTGVLCGFVVNFFMGMVQRQRQKVQVQVEGREGRGQRSMLQAPATQNKQNKNLKQSKQLTPAKPSKSNKANKNTLFQFYQSLHINNNKSTKLTDVDLFEQLSYQAFPLFLQAQDKFQDEQQTARKMLNQVILSHVKQNNQNYISINPNKINYNQNNVRTNNSNNGNGYGYESNKANINKKLFNQNQKQSGKKNNKYAIQTEHIIRNNYNTRTHGQGLGHPQPHAQTSPIQHLNNMQDTPKSSTSAIKNQAKEIKQMKQVYKEAKLSQVRQAKEAKIGSRQTMPPFYADHINKQDGKMRGTQNIRRSTEIEKITRKQTKEGNGIMVISKFKAHEEIITSHNNDKNLEKEKDLKGVNEPNKNKQKEEENKNMEARRTKSQAFLGMGDNTSKLQREKQGERKFQMSQVSQIQQHEEAHRRQKLNRKLDYEDQPIKIDSYKNQKKQKQFRSNESSIKSQNQHKAQYYYEYKEQSYRDKI